MFPLQIALLLSDPGAEFTGGEFVLTEQRPRMQSRASVVPLGLGEAVIFAVNERPLDERSRIVAAAISFAWQLARRACVTGSAGSIPVNAMCSV